MAEACQGFDIKVHRLIPITNNLTKFGNLKLAQLLLVREQYFKYELIEYFTFLYHVLGKETTSGNL